ncbi:MAG: DUF1109 family protein [Proteobacteria bacterium]|nr:DUF1109 family protein [Pseudomonadota bacterium]
MNDERIGALIENLGQRLNPVRPLRHPALRVMPVFILVAAWIAAAVLFIGIRHDIFEKIAEGTYLFELILSLGVVGTAMAAAAWLAVPDIREQGWILTPPLTLMLVLFLWILVRTYGEGFHLPSVEWSGCAVDGMLMGFVPVAALIVLTKRGASTHPYLESLMIVMAVMALGWVGLRITCASDDLGHCFFFHFMPFAVAGAVMGALARHLYRW